MLISTLAYTFAGVREASCEPTINSDGAVKSSPANFSVKCWNWHPRGRGATYMRGQVLCNYTGGCGALRPLHLFALGLIGPGKCHCCSPMGNRITQSKRLLSLIPFLREWVPNNYHYPLNRGHPPVHVRYPCVSHPLRRPLVSRAQYRRIPSPLWSLLSPAAPIVDLNSSLGR